MYMLCVPVLVCVCVCACARVYVCVCVCVCVGSWLATKVFIGNLLPMGRGGSWPVMIRNQLPTH